MARKDFINQAEALGFKIQEPDGVRLYFEYVAPVGKNINKRILLGFEVNDDFPMSCPTGPHIKAIDDGWKEHTQNISDSPFNNCKDIGSGWRYWSRPFTEWNRSERTVKTYLAHIKNIFMTV